MQPSGRALPARIAHEGDVLVVEIESDRVDAASTPTLRKQLALPLSRTRNVVLDLHRVEFLDSSGLGLLFWIRNRQQARCGGLHLCGVAPRLRATLALVRADAMLPTFEDAPSAVGAFQPAA